MAEVHCARMRADTLLHLVTNTVGELPTSRVFPHVDTDMRLEGKSLESVHSIMAVHSVITTFKTVQPETPDI